jgi:glyoxylase-like metal-dependent hydrolase (beta-lactamase superfamily II)
MTQYFDPRAVSPNPAANDENGAVERVSALTRRVIAPNPGPFTFDGTCSYIVGQRDVAIIDPGPADQRHIDALLDAIAGETLHYVLVTHTHHDHSPAAQLLRSQTGARIIGCAPYLPPSSPVARGGLNLDAAHDPAYAPDRVLQDGEILRIGDVTIETVATPGHTANHLCFALREDRALFTGDHVMAWATTVVAPPDGSMGDYFASLERLRERDDSIYWPAHGGSVREPQRYLRALIHHRRQRELAILERLEKGDQTVMTIVEHIYEGVDPRLHGAAALSVFAHLLELIDRGKVASEGPLTLDGRYFRT